MSTLCGADCSQCRLQAACHGCTETGGRPFGGQCMTAEYIKAGGREQLTAMENQIMDEFNALQIDGMPKITKLYSLAGSYVNLCYPMPSGESVKLLNDSEIYLGTQVCSEFSDGSPEERCFGLVAGFGFLLVCEYGPQGTDPEIVLYKRR